MPKGQYDRAAAMRAKHDSWRANKLAEQEAKNLAVEMGEETPELLSDPVSDVGMTEHTWLGPVNNSPYIPSWYKPHKQNWPVKQAHEPLGFKISDVMPHRRWAIQGNGELIDQRDFEPLYERYLSETAARGVDPKNQHIPRVERFVNAMKDPREGPGLVAIGFDPGIEPPKEQETLRYDPIKDVIFEIKEDLERASRVERIESLFRMKAAKQIDDATYEKEMRALTPDLGVDASA